MTAFSLDPVQTAWCAELRALAEERLRPLAEKGEPGHVNRALVAELGRLGLLARLFTSGALDLCLMRESLARGCTEAETALALQGLGAHPVHAYGTRAQRERWLPRVADGSAVAAFALSEPGAGSDAAALALRADRDDARAPTSAPGPGEAAPAARGASPVASGAAPGVPGAVPAASGVVPAVPGTLPAHPGSSPEASGIAPGVPGAVPAASGVAPGVPGAVPAASGVAPAASGTVPVGPGPSVVGAQESPVAERDGWGSWRLSGEKCWISNAPEADFYTVFARTTPGAGARGVTAFLVPADRPGLAGTPLDMLSPHPIGALAFDAVPVTADDVLGEPDRGFRVAMHTLNLFRPSVGAFAVGMAEAALAATLTHTAGREAFGGRLKDLQT
ncbi:acyl-CoA dehydrogenase family protein, partial [Streptomyces sp. NPDC057927]